MPKRRSARETADVASVTVTRVTYNGAIVHAEWSASIPPGWTGFTVTLQQIGGPVIANPTVTASSVDIPAVLDGANGYTITVTMLINGQPGVSSNPEYVIAATTSFSAISYNGSLIACAWGLINETGCAQYVVTLLKGTQELNNYISNVPFLSIPKVLDTQYVYTISVAGLTADGISTGPSSVSRTLILLGTDFSAVSYDLQSVAGSINPITQPGMDDYLVTLSSSQTKKNSAAPVPLFDIPGTLDAAQAPWKIIVACSSSDGVVTGPVSPSYQMILDAATMTEVDYDSATLSVSWGQIGDPTVTGYLVFVTAPGSSSRYPTGKVGSTNINQQLDPQKTYQVSVMATDGIVAGPVSDLVTAITATPSNLNIQTPDAQKLEAYFGVVTGTNITGFLAALSVNGTVQEQVTGTASPIVFTTTVVAASVYTSQMRATGVKAKGPYTPVAPGPYLTNQTFTYDRASRIQTVVWGGASTVTYTIDPAGNITGVTWTAS